MPLQILLAGRGNLADVSITQMVIWYSSSRIIVLKSATPNLAEKSRFSVPSGTRVTHIFWPKGQLFVYTGIWFSYEGELPRNRYDTINTSATVKQQMVELVKTSN